MVTVVLLAAAAVAFTNGANANFKGVASLYGSGAAGRRAAALWGTAATLAGSVAAVFLAGGLIDAFRGRGIVPDALAGSSDFLAAVALGAAGTSFLATRFGFPVSTTHALVGALAGAGLAAGADVKFAAFGKLFVLPLLLSPAVAAVAGAVVYLLLKKLRLAPDHRTRPLDALHVLSTGAASFARGLNDTPKMAALLFAVRGLGGDTAILLVGATIALGGLLDSRRVAETLGRKITGMNPGQGFAASLVTAALVITGSAYAVPLSTTHVSVGALTGMGAASGRAHWRKVGEVLLAWASTAPCGAVLAAGAYVAMR